MNQGLSLFWILWLHSCEVAKMGITGTLSTRERPRNRRDYLRETEDMLSYEPFLGIADPPSEHIGQHSRIGQELRPRQSKNSPGTVSSHDGESSSDPMFAGPINNVTV